VSPNDAIADAQRLSDGVPLRAFAEREDAANHLVTEDDGEWNFGRQ
jgi:hypothetical protein